MFILKRYLYMHYYHHKNLYLHFSMLLNSVAQVLLFIFLSPWINHLQYYFHLYVIMDKTVEMNKQM